MSVEKPVRFTFTRFERLHLQSDFSEVLNRGRKLSSPGLFIFVRQRLPGETEQHIPLARMGLVTSRKVGTAVQRNQAKRRLREVFRLHKHLLKPGTDCVFIPRAPITAMTYAAIETMILAHLRDAGVLAE